MHTELALYVVIAARVLYTFYWKLCTVPSAKEWLIKLQRYTLISQTTLYLESKYNTKFNLIWKLIFNYSEAAQSSLEDGQLYKINQ